MAASSSLYTLLGVAPSASSAEIKAAYLKLSLRVHPDKRKRHSVAADSPRAGAGGASEEEDDSLLLPSFESVLQAYKVLSDPALRAEHDAELARAAQQRRQAVGRSVEFTAVQRSELRVMEEEEQREKGLLEQHSDEEEEEEEEEALSVHAFDCRCGDVIVVYLDDHDDSDEGDDSIVSCETCSLSIKVI